MRVKVEKHYIIVCATCLTSLTNHNKTVVVQEARESGWGTKDGKNICFNCKQVLKGDKE